MAVERAPGGFMVLSGGTRNSVNFNRPWQSDIVVDPATCPFEAESPLCEEVVPGWKVLRNAHTPLSFHRLIVPIECWEKERVRTLGGAVGIVAALNTAKSLIGPGDERWLGVHIGPSAGQNQSHIYYHLVELDGSSFPSCEFEALRVSETDAIFKSEDLKVVVAGFRAGQCFLLPLKPEVEVEAVASALHRVISLYAVAFRSVQGLPPDYLIAIRFSGPKILYGVYIPILNQWGFTEYVGLIEKTPLILPWTHAATIDQLRKASLLPRI